MVTSFQQPAVLLVDVAVTRLLPFSFCARPVRSSIRRVLHGASEKEHLSPPHQGRFITLRPMRCPSLVDHSGDKLSGPANGHL
jgi:hypothetical protein